MSIVIEDITDVALSLPLRERAILADKLIDSFDAENQDSSIRDAWVKESQRRLDDIESGLVKPIDGLEGLRRVRESLKK